MSYLPRGSRGCTFQMRFTMTKEEYRSILGRLPIKSPTPEDMSMLCPHLKPEDAVKAFTKGIGYVACPPLVVRDSFQIISYRKEWMETVKVSRVKDDVEDASVSGVKNHPARLEWSYAGRSSSTYLNMDEAMKFAEDNWGDQLILDTWKSVVEIYVQDPTDLVNDRYHTDYPRTKAILRLMLGRDFNTIINDHTKPCSELLDDAIVAMTLDEVEWHEYKGGRGGYTEFNCANCGAGLSLTGCPGCGHRFGDDQFRCGWYTPLSRKMIAFLQASGHHFPVDPEIALSKERK